MTETIVTLTLPERNGNGTLVLRRGEVGHVAHFTYTSVHELTEVIAEALLALANAEETMPVISEAAPTPAPKPAKPAQAAAPRKVAPAAAPEPTIDIPLKKGKKAVKISHLKIVEGETDAAAYAVAVRIASKLIDGKLWDGNSKIELPDVYQLEKKMRHLDASDMALYALADFTAGYQITDADMNAAHDAEPEQAASNKHWWFHPESDSWVEIADDELEINSITDGELVGPYDTPNR